MFVDARTVPNGTLLEADVCIVGAGAGGHHDRPRVPSGAHVEWRCWRAAGSRPTRRRSRCTTAPCGASLYFPLGAANTRMRYFGGSTNAWAGQCRPTRRTGLRAARMGTRERLAVRPGAISCLSTSGRRRCATSARSPTTPPDWRDDGVRPIAFHGERIRSATYHVELVPAVRRAVPGRDRARAWDHRLPRANAVDLDAEHPERGALGQGGVSVGKRLPCEGTLGRPRRRRHRERAAPTAGEHGRAGRPRQRARSGGPLLHGAPLSRPCRQPPGPPRTRQ